MSVPPPIPPGWYPDPSGEPGQRWWDGGQWTEQVQRTQTGPAWSPPYSSQPSSQTGATYVVADRLTGQSHVLALARFWTRFGAAVVDGLILFIPEIIVQSVAGRAFGELLSVLVGLAYTVPLIGGPRGQTVGMRVLGLRVVSADDGGPIGPNRAAARYLMSLVSGFVLALGYLWMLWDPRRQTWHDKVANSVVIKLTDARHPGS